MVIDTGTELVDRGLVGVGRLGPEIGDAERLFERDGSGHHLSINRPQCRVLHRALILIAHLAQNPVLALGHVDPAVLAALEPADVRCEGKALIQQRHQAGVEPVDFLT